MVNLLNGQSINKNNKLDDFLLLDNNSNLNNKERRVQEGFSNQLESNGNYEHFSLNYTANGNLYNPQNRGNNINYPQPVNWKNNYHSGLVNNNLLEPFATATDASKCDCTDPDNQGPTGRNTPGPTGHNTPGPTGRNTPGPTGKGVNPFPNKIIWSYLCGDSLQSGTSGPNISRDLTSSNSLVNLITSQKINYLCLGFLKADTNGFQWNKQNGCKTDYSTLKAQLKTLHDQGVCISASWGGQGSSTQYKNIASPAKMLSTFLKLRSDLDNVLDGIDFDIEALATADYPALGNAINGVAKVFKNSGYVTSAAPTSSQLTPGCGGNLSGWGQSQ